MLATVSQTKDRGPFDDLELASKRLKAVGVRLYAVGVGTRIHHNQLLKLASHPKFVFKVPDFNLLYDSVKRIKKRICKGKWVVLLN